MNDTIDLMLRASRYIAASVKLVETSPGEHEPATESDHVAHDLSCELAYEAARLQTVFQTSAES